MNTELVRPEDLKAEVAPVLARAEALVIVTPDDYAAAGEFSKDISRALKRVADVCDPAVKAAKAAHQAALDLRASFADPLKQAKDAVGYKQAEWYAEQERASLAEQQRLQAEKDEQDRREREKHEAAARLAREKEAAAMRAEEEERIKAQAATDAKAREAALREAEKRHAEAAAAAAKAEAKEEAAASVVGSVVQVSSVLPQVKGQAIRKTWKARVVNLGLVPREYLVVNDQALQAFARATKGAVKIPGVEFFAETSIATTGGR